MRIGVTGATGKYGSEVIKHLLKNVDDNQIVAFARNPKKTMVANNSGVIVRQTDFEDYESLVKGFEDIQRLLIV